MVINTIKQHDVRFLRRVIVSSIYAISKIAKLSAGFIYASYKICVEKEQVNISEILRVQLLENLEKIKRTKNYVFRFQSLVNHLFFHILRRFLFLSVAEIMSSDRWTMEKVIDICRRHPEDKILDNGNLIMKTFQNKMKTRFKISPEIVDRFKNGICFMVDTDRKFIEAVEQRETFLDHLAYELIDNIAIGYIDLLPNSRIDQASYRIGTYEEITQSAYQASLEKASQKKVEIVMKKDFTKDGLTESES